MNSTELKTTDNHDTIREWVEEREGRPALVEGVVDKGKEGKMLRIDFLDNSKDEGLDDMPWKQFFNIFEESNLEFIYQEKTSEGKLSKFCKFIVKE